MNIGDVLRRQAAARPRRPAYSCGGTTYSWDEVAARATNVAARLAAELAPGSRVAILSRSCHRYFETYYAVAMAGLVSVPLNWRLSAEELAQLVRDCDAAALVLDRGLAPLAAEALAALPSAGRLVMIGHGSGAAPGLDLVDYEEVAGSAGTPALPCAKPTEDDLHVIGYTSGTTGTTKGAMITHHSATSAALAYALAQGLTERDRVLACMPGYVYRGGSGGFAAAVAGAHTIVCEFDAARVVEHLRDHDVTQVTLAPVMAARVLAEAERAGFDGTSLQAVWLTGSPAEARTIRGLWERFGTDVGSLYGMTEATGIAMIRFRPDREDLLGSIGHPMLLLDVRLVDPQGREVADGEIGEIAVRGDTVTPGYWGSPELTAERITDGWLHTGDMARRDDEGHLFIVDRRADIIISGGLNVYASQVEHAIAEHPGVAECAVVGAPDDDWGEVPVAIVVPDDELSEAEVMEWAAAHLAGFKRPRRVELVTELPRNAMGKVDKRRLRDPYWAGRDRRVGG